MLVKPRMAAWLAQRRKAEERLRLERLERMEHLTPEESLRAYPALWEFRPATRVDIPPFDPRNAEGRRRVEPEEDPWVSLTRPGR